MEDKIIGGEEVRHWEASVGIFIYMDIEINKNYGSCVDIRKRVSLKLILQGVRESELETGRWPQQGRVEGSIAWWHKIEWLEVLDMERKNSLKVAMENKA